MQAGLPGVDLVELQPGIVDHDVEPAVQRHRPADQRGDLGVVGDVGPHDRGAVQDKLPGERLEAIRAPCVQHQHRTMLRQAVRGGFAQAAAGARDDDLAWDVVHRTFPTLMTSSVADAASVSRVGSEHRPLGSIAD